MRGVFAIVIVLLSPNVAAWSSMGGVEPSTVHDEPLLMWPRAPTAPGQVYFNVVSRMGSGAASVNPNLAALGSAVEPVGFVRHEAILGVWRDCNGDGYVGMAETAAREYASALLLDVSTCPPASGGPERFEGFAHNHRGWVSELIPIGREAGADKRVIVDPEAMVWGDHGRPAPSGDAPGWSQPAGMPDAGGALPRVEPPAPKQRADWNFAFVPTTRGSFPGSLLFAGRAGGADPALGLGPGGARWESDTATLKAPRTLRGDPADGSLDVEGAAWSTFYARVGGATAATGALTPGGVATYGSPFCAGDTGVRHGWLCEAGRWYTYPDGSRMAEPFPLARPGTLYQLRDVDCHDGGMMDDRAGEGLAYYGSSACAAG